MKHYILPIPDLSPVNKTLREHHRVILLAASLIAAVSICSATAQTTTVNFDTAANWVQGSAAFGSYSNHSYSEASWTFTSANAIRNGLTAQDGVAGAFGTYGWRLQDNAGSQLIATFGGSMTIAGFGFDVRRWDGNPNTTFVVEYSTNSGSSYASTGITINSAFLDSSSNWKTLTFSLPIPTAVGPNDFKMRVYPTSAPTERIMIDNFQWTTGTAGPDTTPPIIASRVPDVSASNVAINTPFSITFDEVVVAGGGNVQLFKEAGASDVQVPISAVVIAGKTASFTANSALENNQAYYVLVSSTAFTDQASPTPNAFPGILTETEWTFTTVAVDLTSPAVDSFGPADNSSNAIPTTDLSINYNEAIAVGSGTILIKKSDGSPVDSLTVPGPRVSVSGNTAAINPNVVLEYGLSYYVEVSAGTFKDLSDNPSPVITGDSPWNFTVRSAPSVVISQVYEGLTAADRYIELRNLTNLTLSLDGYRVAAWSDTAPADNEAWKSGTGTTDRVTSLEGFSIPPNGSFLITSASPGIPTYAANNYDLSTSSGAIFFDGDDSIVLYNGAGFTQAEVVDAFSVSAIQAKDTSFHRTNDNALPGFDFTVGTSLLDFPLVWETKTLADVNSAIENQAWYLKAKSPPKVLTLGFSQSTVSEGAGPDVIVATVTRSGPTDELLDVNIAISDTTELTADTFLMIPAGSSSATFNISALNDPYLDGNQVVTVTTTATNFTPGSGQVTVSDELSDVPFQVVINEVDADQPLTDDKEFIELYNPSGVSMPLDGLVVVLYNGGTDQSYDVIDLSGYEIGANDYFVIGSSLVANVDLTEFVEDGIQNGADAVALYFGKPTDFPTGTAVATSNGTLVDAVVYDTSDADDTVLLNALTIGKPQVNEGENSPESIARVPNGGAAYETSLYVAQTPTPGSTNVTAPANTFASWIGNYPAVGGLTGVNDDYDNDGLDNAVENILGSNPAVSNTGLSTISGTSTSVTFRHNRADTPATDLTPSYEWSTDFATWYPSGAGGGITVTIGAPAVITNGSPNDLVEVSASVTSGTASSLFVRLKVTKP